MVCSKDKEQDKLKGPILPEQRVTGLLSLCHSVTTAMSQSPSQAACPVPFPSHIRKDICRVFLPLSTLKVYILCPVSRWLTGSLAIKIDKQPMLIVDFPWLPGSWPAVLAVTLLFNKLYLPYFVPCVGKFFSNPCSDHDRRPLTSWREHCGWVAAAARVCGRYLQSAPLSGPHSLACTSSNAIGRSIVIVAAIY